MGRTNGVGRKPAACRTAAKVRPASEGRGGRGVAADGARPLAGARAAGWVASVGRLLDAYFLRLPRVVFDYSEIRPRGTPIKGFGGVSSGPDALEQLHRDIANVLDALIGQPITVTAIVDLMNLIGRCVVSGNIRRTAEIAFGDPSSAEYLNLKNMRVNPHRTKWSWTSNNSVFAELGMSYDRICELVRDNGEPGFAWLENMRQVRGHSAPAPRGAG